jgi:hypothetical protein
MLIQSTVSIYAKDPSKGKGPHFLAAAALETTHLKTAPRIKNVPNGNL